MILHETKTMYHVTTNSDLTEGRGSTVHFAHCESITTARRLAKGIGVQGTDGYIEEITVCKLDGRWWGPIFITPTSEQDRQQDELWQRKQAARQKAQQAGLTQDEIDLLRS